MRLVNFADGYTLEEPPMTSGAVQEDFELLDNRILWTPITGYSFDSSEITSADISLEVSRIFGGITYRQVIKMDLMFDGELWQLTFGQFSGRDLIQEEIVFPEQISLRVNPESGQFEYKSGYSVDMDHNGRFKFATIRRKA